MMNFIYALDLVVEDPPKKILQGGSDTLITVLCIAAGALLLTSLICIGVAVYNIRKNRKDGDK